jgi:hypothetical protein
MQHVAQKHPCHTQTHKEEAPEPKKQRKTQPVLWCRKNRHTHIKKEKTKSKKESTRIAGGRSQFLVFCVCIWCFCSRKAVDWGCGSLGLKLR